MGYSKNRPFVKVDVTGEVDKRFDEVTSQLAETENIITAQADYVDMIKNMTSYSKMRFRKIGTDNYSIFSYNEKLHASYNIMKDANDDLLKIAECFVGEVSQSVYDHDMGVQSGTGWTYSTNTLSYATITGDTITGYTTGSMLQFRTYQDDRGGVWEITVDDSSYLTTTLSLYSTVKGTIDVTIATGLDPSIEHKVFATFKGDDPNNPPSSGAGTARGWILTPGSPTTGTFVGFVDYNNPVNNLLIKNSNKEFAFSITKGGTTEWVPDHGVGTAFQSSPPIFELDGVEKDVSSMGAGELLSCNDVKIIQSLNAILPNVVNPVAEFKVTYHFDKTGVSNIFGKWTTLQDITINAGYPLMLPGDPAMVDEVVTSFGNSKINAKDSSNFYFEQEKDNSYSVAIASSTNRNLVAASTVNYPLKTLRKGKPDKDLLIAMRYWQRDTTPKLYFSNFTDSTPLAVGDSFIWHGSIAVAKINGVYDYIKS